MASLKKQEMMSKFIKQKMPKMAKECEMDLLKQLQDLFASLEALKAQLVDAEAALAEAKKQAYDEGFAAGVASVPGGDPEKKYTQAELDAAVLAGVDSAVAALKADLKAKYEAAQAKEADEEVAFGELLK